MVNAWAKFAKDFYLKEKEKDNTMTFRKALKMASKVYKKGGKTDDDDADATGVTRDPNSMDVTTDINGEESNRNEMEIDGGGRNKTKKNRKQKKSKKGGAPLPPLNSAEYSESNASGTNETVTGHNVTMKGGKNRRNKSKKNKSKK